MAKLHYFNPDNDIALAAGVRNFTPPKAAVNLRTAGAMLPLWYGDNGDKILTYGVNDRWLSEIEERFSPGVGLFDHRVSEDLKAAPWGWSLASKSVFEHEGFPPSQLPDDALIRQWRDLSHRRTASVLRDEIAPLLDFDIAPAAAEIKSVGELKSYLEAQPASIIKSPWSSSGRGLTDTRHLFAAEVFRRCEGVINRQGSVMVEQAYDRIADFALLFECRNGCCTFIGYSFFNTDNSGNYAGNVLARDKRLLEMIGRYYPADRIEKVGIALTDAIGRTIAPLYDGPLGIDMLVAGLADGSRLLDATVELNLRMTMGFVAHNLSQRYLAEGSEGSYSVIPAQKNPVSDSLVVEDRKIVSGRINLTPPEGLFSFVADVHTL